MKNEFSSKTPLLGDIGGTEAGSSITKDFLLCLKRYQYKHVRKLFIPAVQTISPFAIGTLVAAMRRQWFGDRFPKVTPAYQRTLNRAAQEAAEQDRLPIDPRDYVFATALFGQYVAHWRTKPRPTPVHVEFKMGPGPLWEGAPRPTWRTAKPDDISRYPEAGGALCLADCKTTSGDIGTVVREYELHVQPLQYLAQYRLDPNGERRYGPLAGVLLDVIQKPSAGKKPKFGRVFIEYRSQAVDEFIESMKFHLDVIRRIGWDTPVPRAYGCTYMAGRARVDCEFKDLCRFGSSAASKYKLPGGVPLRRYEPTPGAEKMPWE